MTMTRFSSPAEIIEAYRSNSEQFGIFGDFERLAAKVWHGDEFEKNLNGRMVIVPVGNELCVVPHPAIRIDAVSYYDTGYGKVFECRGFQEGWAYSRYELVSPALLKATGENIYVVATKGVLQLK